MDPVSAPTAKRVFRRLGSVTHRDGSRGYWVGLIVRGISHGIFRSRTRTTEAEAHAAATRWLERHPDYVDTSETVRP